MSARDGARHFSRKAIALQTGALVLAVLAFIGTALHRLRLLFVVVLGCVALFAALRALNDGYFRWAANGYGGPLHYRRDEYRLGFSLYVAALFVLAVACAARVFL